MIAAVLDSDPAHARPGDFSRRTEPLAARALGRFQLALVEGGRGELVDPGVQPPGPAQEEPAAGIDHRLVAEHMLQGGPIHPLGVGALLHLRELLGIA